MRLASFQPATVPTGWSVGPWDDDDGGFVAAWYRGGDLRRPTEIEHGRRITERAKNQKKKEQP